MKPNPKAKPNRRADRKARKGADLAFLQGPTEDGKGARVVRLRDGVLSAGELRPAREGEPLHEREIVRLHPLPVSAPICELEVLYDGSAEQGPAIEAGAAGAARTAQPKSQGPARVASESYRRNWSAVFGAGRRKPTDYSIN